VVLKLTRPPFVMMQDFIAAAVATLEDCNDEVRDCLRKIIVKGFGHVSIVSSFREAVALSYGVEFSHVEKLKQSEVVRLGLLTIGEPDVAEAFRFHASMVDQVWSLLLKGEAA